ncbi:MAG: sporulation protein YabP [Clostridia bacterium]|nr:sporulation protein YabP [Clostridia bacterium]
MQGSGEIVISGREKLTVSGVDGIISFCETEAVLSTSLGYLAVTGSELKVDGFDRGQGNVIINGCINAVFYPGEKNGKNGFFGKLFKGRG